MKSLLLNFLQGRIKIAGIRQLSKAGDERLNAFFDMYKNAVEQARNGDSTRYVELLSSASAERFSFELAGSTSINSVLPSKLTKMLISSNDQIDLIFYSDNYVLYLQKRHHDHRYVVIISMCNEILIN